MQFNNPAQQLRDAQQLKRLRELRERSAMEALKLAEAEERIAAQTVQEREQAMQRLTQDRQRLAQQIVGELARSIGRLAECVSAKQAELDDQLERTEYALIDDEQALAEAREKTELARAAWLRAVSRKGTADTLVGDARKALVRERDIRAEREDELRPAPAF